MVCRLAFREESLLPEEKEEEEDDEDEMVVVVEALIVTGVSACFHSLWPSSPRATVTCTTG